ncbi:luciferin sulfotransferase-like [Athalia rosae]|uniref:luciferin sulfotransferase-like n=1 Tax=Athalia rosae TaxID=37344 RepID=UPI00203393B1|nr:luciferin sulfotransferase-like [Athalia rosae]XP_048510869.1 luciferin sulfotransferase-like [Athalia rosae]XP_048510870.1 luciferin sulfotransferase-like [Athalia rosae]
MENKCVPLKGDLVDLLYKSFYNSSDHGWVKLEGCVLPGHYKKFADVIENFEVRDADVWVCTFPKSGTTWTQEMVWCIKNELDFEGAKVILNDRFPFLELSALWDFSKIVERDPSHHFPESSMNSMKYTSQLSSPRFIKTHLPFHLLPRQIRTREKTPKIVYVTRETKDVCISFYHHAVLIEGFVGTFEDFYTLFLDDKIFYSPYWQHVLGYWDQRHQQNVLLLKFEDMKKDLPSVIKKTADFFDKKFTSDEVALLEKHLSFEGMKANSAVNNESVIEESQKFNAGERKGTFLRSGKVGQWKTGMTEELAQKFDEWTESKLKDTDYLL